MSRGGCPCVAHPFAAKPLRPCGRNGSARLACVRHAASVHSEPGSDSPKVNGFSDLARFIRGPELRAKCAIQGLLSCQRAKRCKWPSAIFSAAKATLNKITLYKEFCCLSRGFRILRDIKLDITPLHQKYTKSLYVCQGVRKKIFSGVLSTEKVVMRFYIRRDTVCFGTRLSEVEPGHVPLSGQSVDDVYRSPQLLECFECSFSRIV